jgi:hypothetical protein
VILQRCFTTLDQVLALVSLGHLSYLGNSYETALSYHRWRNEPIRVDISDMLSDHDQHEYNYLFRENEWFVKFHGNAWHPLAHCVADMRMPSVANTSERWDGKVRYVGLDLVKMVGWEA